MNKQTIKDIDRAFKALEERDELLDKIRAEIAENGNSDINTQTVLAIIDKYKAESEVRNDNFFRESAKNS